MMKAIKNFMDKPITYGGYAKMCIGAFAISVAYVAYIYHKLGLTPRHWDLLPMHLRWRRSSRTH